MCCSYTTNIKNLQPHSNADRHDLVQRKNENGNPADRDSALRATSIYAISEDEHITRCWNCKAQLIFNYTHVKHETFYNHLGAEYLDVIYCPKCNSRIILPLGVV